MTQSVRRGRCHSGIAQAVPRRYAERGAAAVRAGAKPPQARSFVAGDLRPAEPVSVDIFVMGRRGCEQWAIMQQAPGPLGRGANALVAMDLCRTGACGAGHLAYLIESSSQAEAFGMSCGLAQRFNREEGAVMRDRLRRRILATEGGRHYLYGAGRPAIHPSLPAARATTPSGRACVTIKTGLRRYEG